MTDSITLLVEARRAAETGDARVIREGARLTQGDVARASLVSPAAISRWESGARRPTGAAAIRWARVLRLISDTAEAAG